MLSFTLLATAEHPWSLGPAKRVPSFIHTSACWGEMSKRFFAHMSGCLGWRGSNPWGWPSILFSTHSLHVAGLEPRHGSRTSTGAQLFPKRVFRKRPKQKLKASYNLASPISSLFTLILLTHRDSSYSVWKSGYQEVWFKKWLFLRI